MDFGYHGFCLTLALTLVSFSCFVQAKPGIKVDVKVGVNGKQVIHAKHPSNVGLDDDDFIIKPLLPSTSSPIDGTPDENILDDRDIDSRPVENKTGSRSGNDDNFIVKPLSLSSSSPFDNTAFENILENRAHDSRPGENKTASRSRSCCLTVIRL